LSEYGRTRLEKADKMLSDTAMLIGAGRFESAADRAYYAMFHAAQAALVAVGVKAPRTHRGLRSQFGERLVTTGLIEREFSRDLTKAHEVRLESTYEAYAAMDEGEARTMLEAADRFVTRIRQFTGTKS
jgi:uncharacterized protein (UPF0332 family)